MERQTSRRIVRTLLWGAAWGLAESTLGSLLHLMPVPGLAGIVMTPLGVLFMTLAFRETGRPDAALSVSGVAAVLKLSGLFLPGIAPGLILRPAAAILLEGLAASALLAAAPLLIRRKA